MSSSPVLGQVNSILRPISLATSGGGGTTSVSSSMTMTTTPSSTLVGSHSSSGSVVATGAAPSGAVSDAKLKRVLEHNQRLKEQLEMRRISVSEASQSLIKFVTSTKDSFLPTLWGNATSDPFSKQSSGCCIVS